MHDHIIMQWNNQADEFNQWHDLGTDEKVEFAVKVTARRCREIAQKSMLSENQAVEIDKKISEEFDL